MSRVRADDYDNKKQFILERAAALFASKGFSSATMIDVANACEASKSRIYHYFPGKEDVLFAIVSEHIKTQYAELAEIAASPLPVEERFAQFVRTFVEHSAASRNEHLVLMNDLSFLPKSRLKQVRELEAQLVSLLINLLEEINPGLMQPQKVKAPYAMLLFGMIIWTFTWYKKNGAITPKELAARISGLFMNGFANTQFNNEGASDE